LNRKEKRRLVVLNEVEMSKMIGREAAEVIGLSLRHVRRLLAAAETPSSVGTLRRGCCCRLMAAAMIGWGERPLVESLGRY